MIRRLIQLFLGLALYGLSIGFVIRSGLGGNPWDVFHQGVSGHSGISLGTVIIITGALVLLLWIPLRQRPGIGTISNVFMIGIFADVGLWLLPPAPSLLWAWAMLSTGVLLNGIAGGAYIGAGLGPGPRDGLMTGLVKRTGGSVRVIRTGIEMVVLATGWMLGGTVGIGTVIYAVAIGPIVHRTLPFFTIVDRPEDDCVAVNASPCPQAGQA
ncbi:hypothetical protein [Sphingomonas sp.]|uniref:membrane protein YczE n=1 Tax=Sphingomonas sp. TaxID=28214 RepID=UPI0025E217C4|nr:hypothetical protein [Sphingomonas sp.]